MSFFPFLSAKEIEKLTSNNNKAEYDNEYFNGIKTKIEKIIKKPITLPYIFFNGEIDDHYQFRANLDVCLMPLFSFLENKKLSNKKKKIHKK